MAVTSAAVGYFRGRQVTRHVETGAANTQLTVTVPSSGAARRILLVVVKYSASPTQGGVSTSLDSGAGASYDVALNVGSANAQHNTYVPVSEVVIGADDGLVVIAPAGGVGITASVSIYLLEAT